MGYEWDFRVVACPLLVDISGGPSAHVGLRFSIPPCLSYTMRLLLCLFSGGRLLLFSRIIVGARDQIRWQSESGSGLDHAHVRRQENRKPSPSIHAQPVRKKVGYATQQKAVIVIAGLITNWERNQRRMKAPIIKG